MAVESPGDRTAFERRITCLLGIAVALLAVLVGALLVAGLLVGMRYAQAIATLDRQLAALERQGTDLSDLTRRLATEGEKRQSLLGTQFQDTSRLVLKELPGLQRRRFQLASFPPDPNAKMDHLIALNQLLSDEMLLMLRLQAESLATVGEGIGPLPTEKRLSRKAQNR